MDEISEESKTLLREKETELIKLIEALVKLDKSKEWAVLKELVFDRSLKSIERQILSASLNVKIDSNTLYKLQGEWVWAKQYADVGKFVETLKKQLADIKRQLK